MRFLVSIICYGALIRLIVENILQTKAMQGAVAYDDEGSDDGGGGGMFVTTLPDKPTKRGGAAGGARGGGTKRITGIALFFAIVDLSVN